MTLEEGKTYRFDGYTHDTVYLVVGRSAHHWRALILDSVPRVGVGYGQRFTRGEVVDLHPGAKMALEATLVAEQFVSPEEQGKVPT